LRVFVGLFVMLHGLVLPVMAVVPAPDADPPVMGGFWTKSWLLGSGPAVKTAIYAASALSALVLIAAGLSVLGVLPEAWSRGLWIGGAALSLLAILVFWNNWLVVGVIINLVMIGIALAGVFPAS
jgi:hypothetical protein